MEKPSRPRRPIKPRSAAQSTQIPRRDGRTRKQAETPAVDPQGSQAASSPKTQAERKPKGLGIFTRRTPTQHTPPTQERKPGTWRKTPAERLAAATPRQRSHTTTRPTEQPRTTKKRGPEASATGNTVKVGGLEISVRALFAVIMTGLLIALVLPSMYQWARQEQEYREIVARVEEARAKKADVERQLELWNDQDYVASQARERLGYVRPGETQYSVVDPGPEYQDQAQIAAAADHGPARPWIQHFAILTGRADAVEPTPETGKALTNPVLPDETQSDEAADTPSSGETQSE